MGYRELLGQRHRTLYYFNFSIFLNKKRARR